MVRLYETVINQQNVPELVVLQEFDYEEYGGRYDAALLLQQELYLDKLTTEHMYLVCFTPNWMMSIFCVALGSTDSCTTDPKKIATNLLMVGAGSFCLFHNHPNQVLEPSEGDCNVSKIINKVAKLLGITFLGNYIMTKEGYLSVEDRTPVYFE